MKRAEALALALPLAAMAATGLFLALFPPNSIHVRGADWLVALLASVLTAAAAFSASRLTTDNDRLRSAVYVAVWLAAVFLLLALANTCTRPYGD